MAFSVENHKLTSSDVDIKYEDTTKMSGALTPRFLVIHYTAGASFDSDLKTLARDKETEASVHLLIGRDGKIAQIVPFNRIAWHAGESRWGEISRLNGHSIGIELSNGGVLTKLSNGKFVTWFGKEIPDSEVMEMVHERGGPIRGWHTYPQKQLDMLIAVAHTLHGKYRFLDILGHDDISWPRKTDPGPGFPMNSVRSRVLGRQA